MHWTVPFSHNRVFLRLDLHARSETCFHVFLAKMQCSKLHVASRPWRFASVPQERPSRASRFFPVSDRNDTERKYNVKDRERSGEEKRKKSVN